MKNCLVTQLKGAVNNDNLEIFGELRIPMVSISQSPARIGILGSKIEIEGSGHFTNYDGTQDYGKTASPSNELYIIGTNSSSELIIEDKYNCTKISNASNKAAFKDSGTLDVSWMAKLSDLYFYIYYRNLKLDIEQWATYSPTMSTLWSAYGYITGSVENVVENQLKLGRNTGTITFDIQAAENTNIRFNGSKVFPFPSSNIGRLLIIFNSADDVVVKLKDNTIGSYNGSTWTYNS